MKPFLSLLAAVAVPAAALPAVALAQQAPDRLSGRIDLVGEAPNACVLSAPNSSASANAVLQQTGGRTTQVTFTTLVDPATLQAVDATINLDFPLVCNGAHRLTVTTARSGLRLESPAPPAQGFSDVVNYEVEAAWAGQTNRGLSSSTTPVEIDSSDGAAGVVSLNIQIRGGGDRLIAGPYSDTLILELQPAT